MSLRQGNSVIAGGIQIDNTPTSGSSNAVSSDGVYAALGGKADIDASNFDTTGKSTIAGFAMPSGTYDNLTLGASGSTYTAPANGYFSLSKVASSATQYSCLANETTGYKINTAGVANDPMGVFLPVKKGDVITAWYTATGSVQWFRFIYAQGEE